MISLCISVHTNSPPPVKHNRFTNTSVSWSFATCFGHDDLHQAKPLQQYIKEGKIISERGIFLIKYCHITLYMSFVFRMET